MNEGNASLYSHLTNLAQSLGIDIREDAIEGSRGGLYLFKGKRNLVVHTGLSVDQKVDMLIDILKKEDLSNVFIVPVLRDVLGK